MTMTMDNNNINESIVENNVTQSSNDNDNNTTCNVDNVLQLDTMYTLDDDKKKSLLTDDHQESKECVSNESLLPTHTDGNDSITLTTNPSIIKSINVTGSLSSVSITAASSSSTTSLLSTKEIIKIKSEPVEEEQIISSKENNTKILPSSSTFSIKHNNIWVYNISKATKATDLKLYLSKFGKIISTKIVTDGESCYGYAVLNKETDLKYLIANLDNTYFEGKKIKLSLKNPVNENRRYNNNNTSNKQNVRNIRKSLTRKVNCDKQRPVESSKFGKYKTSPSQISRLSNVLPTITRRRERSLSRRSGDRNDRYGRSRIRDENIKNSDGGITRRTQLRRDWSVNARETSDTTKRNRSMLNKDFPRDGNNLHDRNDARDRSEIRYKNKIRCRSNMGSMSNIKGRSKIRVRSDIIDSKLFTTNRNIANDRNKIESGSIIRSGSIARDRSTIRDRSNVRNRSLVKERNVMTENCLSKREKETDLIRRNSNELWKRDDKDKNRRELKLEETSTSRLRTGYHTRDSSEINRTNYEDDRRKLLQTKLYETKKKLENERKLFQQEKMELLRLRKVVTDYERLTIRKETDIIKKQARQLEEALLKCKNVEMKKKVNEINRNYMYPVMSPKKVAVESYDERKIHITPPRPPNITKEQSNVNKIPKRRYENERMLNDDRSYQRYHYNHQHLSNSTDNKEYINHNLFNKYQQQTNANGNNNNNNNKKSIIELSRNYDTLTKNTNWKQVPSTSNVTTTHHQHHLNEDFTTEYWKEQAQHTNQRYRPILTSGTNTNATNLQTTSFYHHHHYNPEYTTRYDFSEFNNNNNNNGRKY